MPHHIAQLLQERCADELDGRARALSVAYPPPTPAARTGPHAPPDVTPRSFAVHRPPEGISTVSAILAMLVGAILGLTVLMLVKQARRERRAAAEAMLDASAPPTMNLGANDVRTPFIRIDADAGAGSSSRQVTLLAPEGARLVVDGHELPPGTTSVPRPTAGVLTVRITAEAREDAVVELAPTSPDVVEVKMGMKPRRKNVKGSPTPSPDRAPSTKSSPPR